MVLFDSYRYSVCIVMCLLLVTAKATTSADSKIGGNYVVDDEPRTQSASPKMSRTTNTLRNVLMITIDDLRPQLNAYGVSETKTPHIDAFAKGATVFQHAYCQMAVCSPSRNSFMSGRRPDTTKVWNFINHFRETEVGANWTSLPQYFKHHGYYSYGAGKLYHPNKPPRNDYPTSWTEDRPHNPGTYCKVLLR